jgi:hypothetical protein
MGVKLSLPRAALTVPLDEFGLSETDKAWVQSVIGGGEQIASTQLDQLSMDPKLTPLQKSIVTGMQRALRGEIRTQKGAAFGKDGVKDLASVDALTLRAARAVSNTADPPAVAKVRKEMPAGLIGHEGLVEDFVRMARDCVSVARRNPPMMAIHGKSGHGKDQAVAQFCKSLLGDNAKVVEVDLSSATDGDLDKLTGENGALSKKALQELAAKKSGLVHLIGCDNLLQRAPKIAQALTQRLLAKSGEPDCAMVPFVFDYSDQGGKDARTASVNGLGPAGNRMLSATAEFKPLDADAMIQYAKALIPDVLKSQGFGSLTLEFDEDAMQVLGRALATPTDPLDEIEQRLHRFLFAQIELASSVDKGAGVLRVSVAPEMRVNKQLLDGTIADLHQPVADLFKGEGLFLVQEVAQRQNGAEARKALLTNAKDMSDSIALMLAPLLVYFTTENDEEIEGAMNDLASATNALRGACDAAAKSVERNEKLKLVQLLRSRDHAAMSSTIAGAGAQLDRFDQIVMPALLMKKAAGVIKPEEMQAGEAAIKAYRTKLTAMQSLVDSLAGMTRKA